MTISPSMAVIDVLRACLAVLLILFPLARSDAQWPTDIVPGARVRVRLPEAQFQTAQPRGQPLRGRVTRLSQDSLYLAVTDSVGPLAVPRGLIERIDLSRGVPSRGTSALIQGVRTAISFGLAVGLAYELTNSPDLSFGEAALAGAGIGLVLGGVVGALRPEERWHRVRLEVSVPGSF